MKEITGQETARLFKIAKETPNDKELEKKAEEERKKKLDDWRIEEEIRKDVARRRGVK